MARYIDADRLVQEINRIVPCDYGSMYSYEAHAAAKDVLCDVLDKIDEQPTTDVEPIRHGHWIRGVSKGFPKNPICLWYCSCCGEKIRYNDTRRTYQKLKKPVNEVNPRCRKCGAKMDGGESQDNDSHRKF